MQPQVAIIMGSDSDLPVLEPAIKTLAEFGVETEVVVASAHRTPDRVHDFAAGAAARGIKVIIAAAGGAAHLPGVVAAYTTLPVIGVPVAGGALSGFDALLSIVQMPSGIPVATMAVNGAKNAALYAVAVLALSDAALAAKLADYRARLAQEVADKARRVQEQLEK